MAASSAIESPLLYVPMPIPHTPEAPLFKGKRIAKFLRKYESRVDAALFTKTQKCDFLIAYCSKKEAKFVTTLDGFKKSDWQLLKTELLIHHGADKEDRYRTNDLCKLVEKRRKMTTFDHFDRYLRRFSIIAATLEARYLFTPIERDELFFRGFPSKFRDQVSFDLQIEGLWADPPHMCDVIATARMLLQEFMFNGDISNEPEPSPCSSEGPSGKQTTQDSVSGASSVYLSRSTTVEDFLPKFDMESSPSASGDSETPETSSSGSTFDLMGQYQSETWETPSAYESESIAVTDECISQPEFDDAGLETTSYDNSASFSDVPQLNDQELRPNGLESDSELDIFAEDPVTAVSAHAPTDPIRPDEAYSPLYDSESASEADHSQRFVLPEISADIAEMSDLYQFAFGFEPDVPKAGPRPLSNDQCHLLCNVPRRFESFQSNERREPSQQVSRGFRVASQATAVDVKLPRVKTCHRVFTPKPLLLVEHVIPAKATRVAPVSLDQAYEKLPPRALILTPEMCRLKQPKVNLSVAIPIEEYSSVESSTESINASCQEIEPIDAASTSHSHEAEDATPVHSENEFLVPCDRAGEYSERLSTKESSVSVWDSSGESSASGYGEAKMRAERRHFTPEYNEGSGSPPKKDPDKALSCESDPNRGGEAPKHVRMPSLPTISEFNDGYAEPPTKDPDKALYMNKRPGDAREYESEETLEAECSREIEFQGDTFAVENPDGIYVVCDDMIAFFEVKHESKVTPEAESIRDAKLHSDILTLEMPEGTYIICDDEIALFEVNEPSRKSNVARVLDSAQEDSEHEHKEPRPPGLNDELNCCSTLCTDFRREVSVLETPEGIYVIHGGLVILFEVAQAAEREIQFRPSLAQDGTEFKAKSEPKSLSLSDELSSMPISVTLTRELNREQDYDLIDKDANIHDVFDAMNGPTSRNLVSAGPGNGAPQPPKIPRSPDLVDDGYECRPEKDPDKVSNMNKRPGNGPARGQESEETPEVKCLRGVESQGDTHILAMPEGIFSVLSKHKPALVLN